MSKITWAEMDRIKAEMDEQYNECKAKFDSEKELDEDIIESLALICMNTAEKKLRRSIFVVYYKLLNKQRFLKRK